MRFDATRRGRMAFITYLASLKKRVIGGGDDGPDPVPDPAKRYWRMQATKTAGSDLLDISHIALMGDNELEVSNPIQGQFATSSDFFAAGLEGYRAFDGNLNTRWASTADGINATHWIIYDFGDGADQEIIGIWITPALENGRAPADFTVAWSPDLVTWYNVATYTGQNTGWAFGISRPFYF